MKIATYVGTRLTVYLSVIILLWYGAHFTLSQYIREGDFGFVAELDRFFSLSFVFSLLFLIYTLSDIQKFQRNRNVRFRNIAICLSVFAFIATTTFFIFDKIYS